MVVQDIKDGLSSAWTADNVYHVVYDSVTLRVDHAATEQRRADERQKRLASSEDYSEFERRWLTQKPSEQVLRYYGNWPNPSKPPRSEGDE